MVIVGEERLLPTPVCTILEAQEPTQDIRLQTAAPAEDMFTHVRIQLDGDPPLTALSSAQRINTMQQNTCCYPNCLHAQAQEELTRVLDLQPNYPQSCCNFIQTEWVNEKGEKCTTRDCSPKLLVKMQSDILNRGIAVQQVVEKQRNGVSAVLHLVREGVERARLNGKDSADKKITAGA